MNVIRNTAKHFGSILFFSAFKGIFKFGHQKKLTILVKIGDWGHIMECVLESEIVEKLKLLVMTKFSI